MTTVPSYLVLQVRKYQGCFLYLCLQDLGTEELVHFQKDSKVSDLAFGLKSKKIWKMTTGREVRILGLPES